jgi:hypothetical protein
MRDELLLTLKYAEDNRDEAAILVIKAALGQTATA